MPETPPPHSVGPIGKAIRKRREREALSIAELAELGGLDAGYLTNIELGKANPTLFKLEQIAAALGVPVFELFRSLE